MISEHDKQLLDKAKALHYTEWYIALDLAELADSAEVREQIEWIGKRLYHTEEYHAGML